jgi:hypothetical protein
MRKLMIIAALALGSQAAAQEAPKSILDVLPNDVEQSLKFRQLQSKSDTCVYTYQIDAIEEIDNLVFVEHRLNEFTNAMVYEIEGTPFKVRLVTPDEDDQIQDPYIRVYRR